MATEENQAPSPEIEGADLLDDVLMSSISEGTIIPIISNSFRLEEIFRNVSELTEKVAKAPGQRSTDESLTVYQQLTREWADSIQYPLPDDSNLARVAQYFQIDKKNNDVSLAKREYLNFLKAYLLDPKEPDKLAKEAPQKLDKTFSDIVSELGYPIFPDGMQDPLRQLANLPLPVYITTSYYNFLERALKSAEKRPRTQVCSWGGAKARGDSLPDPDFIPSPETPVVYHLFGLENYPTTLVLSEDDYMNWQISVAEELSQQITNTTVPGIPLRLRDALAEKESQLMILGYNLQDWEFRVLFRFIWRFRKDEDLRRSTVIQLKPRPKNTKYEQIALGYLKQYFNIKRSNVKWTRAESYIQKLSEAYDRYIGKGVIA
jgi:SIR2-like protein